MGKLAYVSIAVGSDGYETDLLSIPRSPVKIPRQSHLDPNTTDLQTTPIIQKQTSRIMFDDYATDYENEGYVSLEDADEEASKPGLHRDDDSTGPSARVNFRRVKRDDESIYSASSDAEPSPSEAPITLTDVTRKVSEYVKDTVTDWTNAIANFLPAPESQLAAVNDYVDDDIYAQEMQKNLGYDPKSVAVHKDNAKKTAYTKFTKRLSNVVDVLTGRKSTLKEDGESSKRIDAYKKYAGDVLDYERNSDGIENGIRGKRSGRNRKQFCCFCIPMG